MTDRSDWRLRLGRGRTYVRRLLRWSDVALHVRGETAKDINTLLSATVGAPWTALRSLERWQDPMVDRDIDVVVRRVGRFHVRGRTDDLWHVLPTREIAIFREVDRLRPGQVFVDAGANIGFYTVLAGQRVGPSGTVIAIEMIPTTAGILRTHVSTNRLTNVHVVEGALSDVADQEIVASLPLEQHGQASITRSGGREVRVRTTTLAAVLASVDVVDLMKLDLEGAELMALRGASNALHKVRAVIFEDWGAPEVGAYLESEGYSVRRLDRNNCIATRS
jgi:FkbM family methyltransferase